MSASRKIVPGKTCPECGGKLAEEIRPYSLRDVFFGHYPFYVCTKCAQVLTPLATMSILEQVAKAKGLGGADLDLTHVSSGHPRNVKAHA